MAAATAEDWFASTVKPDASVAEYTAAPPRGMTNPPQNPKVRAELLKDLAELSVPFEAQVWPPPLQRSGPPGPGSLELRWRLGMPRCPSCPAVFGGTSCASRAPQPLPQVKPRTESREKKNAPKGKGRKVVSFYQTEPPPSTTKKKHWVYSAALDGRSEEFEVSLEKAGSMRLGITIYGGRLLANPEPGTLFDEWNKENPERKVSEGDHIVEVNDIRDDLKKMTKQIRKAEVWDLKLARGWSREADALGQSHGSPTALWRTKRNFFLEDEDSRIGGTAPPDAMRPGKAAGAAAGDPKTWRHPQQQKIAARVPTDVELRNAREALKGQSSLHQSASADRFRYCADLSRGAPLCIKGPGVPSGQPDEVWASDGALLNMFHNRALRLVNPSNLEPTKEEEDTGRRRKRRGDEDELKLSDSGMFKPRYPIDNSLKSLRRLKKEWFPDDTKQREAQERLRFLKGLMEDSQQKDRLGGIAATFAEFRKAEAGAGMPSLA